MDLLDFKKKLEELKEKKGGAPHKRAYWCGEIAKITNWPIKQIMGMTSGWPISWIEQSYLDAKQGRNPGGLWNWWYKQTKL